jgi:anti-sigma regulatory factor (Ser/Thr protein kinase)
MAGSMSSDAGSSGGTPHAVALYGSVEELRRRVMPFLRAGLIAGDTVLAVVSQPAAAGLQDALGTERGNVRWELPGVSYDNLGPMFDGLRRYLADQHEAGNRIRLLAENAAPADATRTAAYLRFEAASNDVLGRYGFPWACLYDRRRYPPDVVEQLTQVHPLLLDHDGQPTASDDYLAPDTYLDAHPGPLSSIASPLVLDTWFTTAHELSPVRRTASEAARSLGVPARDDVDFDLAAGEVLSNALRHGEQPCRLRVWGTAGHVVLRVDDQGTGDHIAVKGFRPPDLTRGHLGGMGVWMIRHLADTVHIGTGPAGTAVELRFRRG